MKVLIGRNRQLVELASPPLHTGGEGEIRSVIRMPRLAAKIMAKGVFVQEEKLRLIRDRLLFSTTDFAVCAPRELVYAAKDRRQCIGCLLNYEANLKPLFQVLRELRDGRRTVCAGLRLALNVSQAFTAIHQADAVIGDVNDSNILASANDRAVLVDVDSFQVRAGSVVFRCTVGRPEFTPPELQGVRFETIDRTPASDNFGLAVVVFSLLMRGYHPFAAGYSGPGNAPPLATRIRQGAFPNALGGIPHFHPKRTAPSFGALPSELQKLFRQCFEGGHRDPFVRPSAAEWCQVLQRTVAADLAGVAATGPRPRVGNHRIRSGSVTPYFRRIRIGGRGAMAGAAIAASLLVVGAGYVSRPTPLDHAARLKAQSTVSIGQPTPKLWQDLVNDNVNR